MSSEYVRTTFNSFITAATSGAETVIDITSDFEEINDFLALNSLTYASNWVGLYYVGDSELPISIPTTNDTGLYREQGSIYIHVVTPTSIGCHTGIITRAEVIRNLVRGKRLGNITIESVSPVNFNNGYSLDMDAGFTSGVLITNYHMDLNL